MERLNIAVPRHLKDLARLCAHLDDTLPLTHTSTRWTDDLSHSMSYWIRHLIDREGKQLVRRWLEEEPSKVEELCERLNINLNMKGIGRNGD